MGEDAVPAGSTNRTLSARAAPGLRPPALRPAARSLLMVRATRRKTDQPPEARPGVVKDTAMERRGAQAFSDRKEGPCTARCTLWALRGAPFPRHVSRVEEEGRPPRAFNNRGDGVRRFSKPITRTVVLQPEALLR